MTNVPALPAESFQPHTPDVSLVQVEQIFSKG